MDGRNQRVIKQIALRRLASFAKAGAKAAIRERGLSLVVRSKEIADSIYHEKHLLEEKASLIPEEPIEGNFGGERR